MNETPTPTQAEVDALFPNETENNGFIKKAIQINIERIDQTKYLLYVFDHPVYKANMTTVFQDIRKDLRSEFKIDIETATVLFYDETGEITKAVKAKSHAELKDIVDKLENYIKNEKNY